ncbi:MAG: flagellar biosynthesis protein FlhB [Phycisphaerales bacterium]|nr:flagellar biosynthesis protein FlhB [Phycisphaerales bacterium]
MAEDLGERTEDATPRKLREAREEGRIAKSADATSAIILLGATVILGVGMRPMLVSLAAVVERALEGSAIVNEGSIESLHDSMYPSLGQAGFAALPLLFSALAVSVLAVLWQTGFIVSTKSLAPKLERLNLMQGFGRMFSIKTVIKTVFDVLKLVVVTVMVWTTCEDLLPQIATLPGLDALACAEVIGMMTYDLAIRVSVALLIIGLLDYVVQWWKHGQDLRMSKQQVKEEFKESDGDPDVKRRRMQIARQMAMQRLTSSVPRADVIVTNPEHLSIAIQYDAATMGAPRIVAMGADQVAFRIRQIALKHSIPIMERKPLARALFAACRVGQEVPAEHYKAIAEVLAYVYRLKNRTISVAS